MDVEKLLKALDNENNSKIMNLTSKKMNSMKMEILRELDFSTNSLYDYMSKLKNYRYVDEMNELDIGRFIRWINISDPTNIYLNNGATICDIKIDDYGIFIVVKTFSNKHFQIKMDECLIFQKLSIQEEVILNALDHLEKH